MGTPPSQTSEPFTSVSFSHLNQFFSLFSLEPVILQLFSLEPVFSFLVQIWKLTWALFQPRMVRRNLTPVNSPQKVLLFLIIHISFIRLSLKQNDIISFLFEGEVWGQVHTKQSWQQLASQLQYDPGELKSWKAKLWVDNWPGLFSVLLDYISTIPKTWDCRAESNINWTQEGPEGLPLISIVSDCDRPPTNRWLIPRVVQICSVWKNKI